MDIRRALAGIVAITALVAGLLVSTVTPAAAAFSGANGWIAFASDRDGDLEIYLGRADGTAVVQLTSNTAQDYEPNISADGSQISFISDRSGAIEVWSMKIDGSGPVQLGSAPTIVESHPVWNPLGGSIAFAGSDGVDSEIYTMKANGTGRVNLTNNATAFDANPAWSPGGLRIAFDSTDRGGDPGTNVYTMKNDGTSVTQLTTSGVDSHPNYAPDNKNIVFQSIRDSATGPGDFASVNKPTGVAVTADAVLVTQFNNDRVRSFDSSGTMTTFAELPPTGNRAAERYIAISPGLGGFPADYVYVTVGKDIYEITPDGTSVELFVNIPDLQDSQTGITFDTVGGFQNRMILTDRTGPIWSVDHDTRSAIKIGDLGRHVQESPVVAPESFIPYDGQLLVGSKFVDKIYAMTPGGHFEIVGDWDSPKGGNVVPSTVCEFGTSGGAYFVAFKELNKIMKFSASHFAGLGGDVLMPSELTTNIAQLHSNGSTIEISEFWPAFGSPDLEGSAFAPCAGGASAPASAQDTATTEIYRMTTSGASQARLTNNSFDDTVPAWSPNGATIVFSSDRDDPNAPGCRDTGTCVSELYTMNATDGTGQTRISTAITADDVGADWQALGFTPSAVADFSFSPPTVKPKQGSSVMWDFFGPSLHTATDESGMELFDSGLKAAGTYYVFTFTVAGNYAFNCILHPEMSGTVKVPLLVAPSSGTEATVFTITWATKLPGTAYRADVQIQRPGGVFEDWRTNQSGKSATFTSDAGPGVYSFRARLRNTTNGFASNYSAPVSITVNP
jgi:Tol biopolymer transport system component